MEFYSYLWLREDGTPYYAGKGTGKRALVRGSHHLKPPEDKNRILIFSMANEAEALESEIALIDLFGRKDIGTGCLRNFTNGGDGVSGLRHSEDAKRRMSVGHLGRSSWNKGLSPSPEYRAALSEGQRKRTTGRVGRKGWRLSAEKSKSSADARRGLKRSAIAKHRMSVAAFAREARKRETKCQISAPTER